MTKILYLSYDGITDPLGQSQILPYLKGLTKYGYHFLLMGFEKSKNFSAQEKTIRKEIKEFPIQWIPLTYHKSPPVLSTLFDIWKMRTVTSKLIEKNDIKLVHCRSYITMLVGMYLKRKYNVKLIFDMRGFWADERVDGGLWRLNNPVYKSIYRYFKKKEMAFSTHADHIVSLTHAGKKEMTSGRLFTNSSLKVRADKISVIPCATDFKVFDPKRVSDSQISEFKIKLGITDQDKILIYLGSLGTWYKVKEMLEFFKQWKAKHQNFKFLFVTKDNTDQIYLDCKELEINAKNVMYTSAHRNEVPIYLKLADLGIFFIKPAYSKKASSAVKMGEIMAMGLSFVFNTNFGDGEILDTYSILNHASDCHFDIGNLQIRKTIENPNKLIACATALFGLEEGIRKYVSVYKT